MIISPSRGVDPANAEWPYGLHPMQRCKQYCHLYRNKGFNEGTITEASSAAARARDNLHCRGYVVNAVLKQQARYRHEASMCSIKQRGPAVPAGGHMSRRRAEL